MGDCCEIGPEAYESFENDLEETTNTSGTGSNANPNSTQSTSPSGTSGQTSAAGGNLSSTPYSFRTGSTGGLVPCTDDCTLCHLVLGIKNIFEYLIYYVLFPLFMLGITIAGILYMVSSGDKKLIEAAKKALTYSLTGFALALLSWVIVNFVMLTLGYQSPYGAHWWEFTCDTTPPPMGSGTLGPGGSTLPSDRKNTANMAQGDGTCGGTKSIVEDPANCAKTSKALDDVLACIKGNVAMGNNNENSYASSLKKINIFESGIAFAAGRLSIGIGIDYGDHVTNSCHYGGRNCWGQANAADLHGDLPAIKNAAIACGADSVIYNQMAYYGGKSKSASDHPSHVHISVNNKACGCDYLR